MNITIAPKQVKFGISKMESRDSARKLPSLQKDVIEDLEFGVRDNIFGEMNLHLPIPTLRMGKRSLTEDYFAMDKTMPLFEDGYEADHRASAFEAYTSGPLFGSNRKDKSAQKLRSSLFSNKKGSPIGKDTKIERINFEDSKEKRYFNLNLIIKGDLEGEQAYNGKEPDLDDLEARDEDFGPGMHMTRSAFKYSKSPYSNRNMSTNVGTSIKDVRMKLDFSKVSSSGQKPAAEPSFYSDKKCSVDENYISKKFTLKKLNYNDIRHEVEKLNKVKQRLIQLRGRREASIEKVLAKELLQTAPGREDWPDRDRKIKCNCKNSRCLKLYCECFRGGLLCCHECKCSNCLNMDNNDNRKAAFAYIKSKNPDAFKPRIDETLIVDGLQNDDSKKLLIHAKGCSCKKSGCVKMYCECYQAGIQCSFNCKCEGCRNCEQPDSMHNSKKKRGRTHKKARRGQGYMEESHYSVCRPVSTGKKTRKSIQKLPSRGKDDLLGKRGVMDTRGDQDDIFMEGSYKLQVSQKNFTTFHDRGCTQESEFSRGTSGYLRKQTGMTPIRINLFSDKFDTKHNHGLSSSEWSNKENHSGGLGRRKSQRVRNPCTKNIFY